MKNQKWIFDRKTESNECDWYGIKCANDMIKFIDVSGNQLSGELPTEIGQFVKCNTLNLVDNNIVGSLPNEIGLLQKLRALRLYNNKITGTIPTELGNCKILQYMRLKSNRFSGSLPLSQFNYKVIQIFIYTIIYFRDLYLQIYLNSLASLNLKLDITNLQDLFHLRLDQSNRCSTWE